MKNKWRIVIIVAFLAALIYGGANIYLVRYAFERNFTSMGQPAKKKRVALKKDQKWLSRQKITRWSQTAVGAKTKLKAIYLPAEKKTDKSIVIAHGYRGDAKSMASYIKMFHQLGYNVLAPDDRAAGQSSGKYITFGWKDRLDYLKWINKIIQKDGKKAQIGLFGVSMGGATVMMISGEKLPKQVKAVVEDCGYSSVYRELGTQLTAQFKMPKEPILSTAALMAQSKIGYNFTKQGSAVAQLKKNTRPMLLIHGDSDAFVPTAMLNENYRAVKTHKEKWLVKKTAHAMAYYNYPKTYTQKVGHFFSKYLK
ncbi:hypothetical protein SAMN05216431_104139 [Ligilactobacillus sp. WC1T17]|uniref:Serine aminopeptidase S33 domain-containing protein n=1 Tax=Ligilactobacillus ruminis TaxID=1623 RepID=A0ABY1AAV2_9LACO|nr:hypothetical protein SAMN05216431_104139 [Ligilactobacillus ruminis]